MNVDTALLRNVRRELRVLEKKAKSNPTPDDILDIAGALRHLLIDEGQGLLKRGWDELKPVIKDMPKEPAVSVIDLGWILDSRLPHIESGQSIVIANDVTTANGARIMAHSSYPGIIPDEDFKKQVDCMVRTWQKLSWYRDSVCMILGPAYISRGTIIKYVANKLGGRHYDKRREARKPKVKDHIYQLLDNSFDFYGDNPQPQNLQVFYGETGNALHAAILSVCQDFEESPDIQWFISTIDKTLQPPPKLGFK